MTHHALTIAAESATAVPIITTAGARDVLALLALASGLFFMFAGALGVYRFPDAYARMHAASKCTTLGLVGLLLAASLHLWTLDIAGKSVIVVVFTVVATPLGTHLLAKAAHHSDAELSPNTLEDELAKDKANPAMSVTDSRIDGETDVEEAPRTKRFAPRLAANPDADAA